MRYKDVQDDLQRVMNQGRRIARDIKRQKRELENTISNKNSDTNQAAVDSRKRSIQSNINYYQSQINRYLRELLKYQDSLDDVDVDNDAKIAEYDKQIADIQDNITNLQSSIRGLFSKGKSESLEEDFNIIQLTKEDQASNIRSLIKTCWDNVDRYSMFAQQLNEFGSQQVLAIVNTLINDLYIAIGSFEEELSTVDPKSTALDAIDQVQAVAQVAPQVATQMAVQPVMIEKFQLSEDLDEDQSFNEGIQKFCIKYKGKGNSYITKAALDPDNNNVGGIRDVIGYKSNDTLLFDSKEEANNFVKDLMFEYNLDNSDLKVEEFFHSGGMILDSLSEDLDEKPDAQEELEEPIKKELKEVEKYRKEKVKDSLNPDPEDTIEETSDMTMVEDLGEDESYNPKFFESLLKLED